MKKLSIFSVVALFALTAMGCSDDKTDAPHQKGVKVTFQAQCSDQKATGKNTRINIAEDKPSWVVNDAIGVYTGENVNAQFSTTGAAEIAAFTGRLEPSKTKVGDPVYAYYPYGEQGIALPNVQKQRNEQFGRYAVMTAQGKVVSASNQEIVLSGMRFHAHTASLRFHVYGSMREVWGDPSREVIQKLTIKTATPVANQVTFENGQVSFTEGQDKEMTVELEAAQRMFYQREKANGLMLTVPAQTMTIQEVVITTNQAVYAKTINKELKLEKGHILPIYLNINTFKMKEHDLMSISGDGNGWGDGDGIGGRKHDFFAGMYDYSKHNEFKYRHKTATQDNWYGFGNVWPINFGQSGLDGGANIQTKDLNPKECYTIVRLWNGNAAILIKNLELRGDFSGWNAGEGRMFEFQPDQNLWKIQGVQFNQNSYMKVYVNDGAMVYTQNGGKLVASTPLACQRTTNTGEAAVQVVAASGTYDVLLDLTCEDQGVLVLEPTK